MELQTITDNVMNGEYYNFSSPSDNFILKNNHAVSVTIETVFFRDRFPVGAAHQFGRAEGVH